MLSPGQAAECLVSGQSVQLGTMRPLMKGAVEVQSCDLSVCEMFYAV